MPGQVGGSLLVVSASQEYVRVPQCPAATNTLTISLWAYANTRQVWGSFVKNWGSSEAGQFHFGIDGSAGPENIYIKQADGKTPNCSDTAVFPIGSWQHVAVVCDGSTVWLYRNGAVVASTTYNGTFIPQVTPAVGIGVKLSDDGSGPRHRAPVTGMGCWTMLPFGFEASAQQKSKPFTKRASPARACCRLAISSLSQLSRLPSRARMS